MHSDHTQGTNKYWQGCSELGPENQKIQSLSFPWFNHSYSIGRKKTCWVKGWFWSSDIQDSSSKLTELIVEQISETIYKVHEGKWCTSCFSMWYSVLGVTCRMILQKSYYCCQDTTRNTKYLPNTFKKSNSFTLWKLLTKRVKTKLQFSFWMTVCYG